MKKKILFMALVLSSCASSIGGSRIFTAYIQTAKTDEKDRPKEIYILADDVEYKIVNNDQGKALREYVDKKVTIKGEVSGTEEGEKFIEVNKFQLDE